MRLLYDLFSLYSGSSPSHGGGVYGLAYFRESTPGLKARAGLAIDALVPAGARLDATIVFEELAAGCTSR